ncbi:MAG: glycosyltransferase [Anaerolineae bacterium]
MANAKAADSGKLPFVSLIVPVYNDAAGLSETLAALARQDYPVSRWEVIVVDNDSTDNTLDVAKSLRARIPKLKILVERSRQSSYAARNRGVEEAAGEILAFIDADMTVGRDWISRGVRDIESGRGDYVGCRVHIYARSDPPTMWEIYSQRTGFRIRDYIEKEDYTIAGSLFVRREVVEIAGMFDERLISAGDREFGNRVKASGFRLYYDHDNVMRHPARSSLRSTWSKHFRIGKGMVDLRLYYPHRYGALKPWSIIPVFPPAVSVGHVLDTSDLGPGWKCRMLFVANVVRLARACGRMVRFATIGRGVGVR